MEYAPVYAKCIQTTPGNEWMSLQTEKMIYANEFEALAVKALMCEQSGPHEVYKLAGGWQVVPVHKLAPYMPPAKPFPISPQPVKSLSLLPKSNEIVVVMKLRDVSKVYVNGWHPVTGKITSFGKTTLLGWEVSDDGTQVKLRMLKAVAAKRGLLGA